MKYLWFVCGSVAALTTVSVAFGSIPSSPIRGRITDDTAIYQGLSEVHVAKEGSQNFDGDLERLSALEGRYAHERLPSLSAHPRLRKPMQRIAQQKYRTSNNNRARN